VPDFESLWSESAEENARRMVRSGHEPDSRAALQIRTVIEAKLAVASKAAATWTKRLALATFALAVATVALAIVAAVK
jgi:hypothetical protein